MFNVICKLYMYSVYEYLVVNIFFLFWRLYFWFDGCVVILWIVNDSYVKVREVFDRLLRR